MAATADKSRYLATFRADYLARNIRREYCFRDNNLLILPDVFPSDSPLTYGAQGITEAVEADLKSGKLKARAIRSAVDVGTGCGVLLVWLARVLAGVRLVCLDIDPVAVENAKWNLTKSHVRNWDSRESDLFSKVPQRFDLVVASLPMTIAYQASDEIDCDTLKRFCGQLPAHLERAGCAYVAWASWADFDVAETIINSAQLRIAHHHTHAAVFPNCFWRTYVLVEKGDAHLF